MLKAVLQKIGLTEKDAEIYLACLELGTQPASIIAKKAGLKRPTTYLILEGLTTRGLVSEYTGSNVKYFTAVQPDYLLHYIDKQKRELSSHQRELEGFLPQFNALSNPYSLNPRVRFYDGVDGIERVMEDTLTTKSPIVCYADITSWFAREDTRKYLVEYGKKRVNMKQIPERVILTDTPIARKYMEQDYPRSDSMTEVRWTPKGHPTMSNEINIYDNKIGIVTLGRNELLGIIIESEEIANTQRAIFELAWRQAVKGKSMT